MGKFYVTDGTYLMAEGFCQDGLEAQQAFGGFTVVAGEPPAGMVPRKPPPPRYDALREREYPHIGDQLDALWKAIGPTAPGNSEARAMYDKILAVKAKYPKP